MPPLTATEHVMNLLRACGPQTLSEIAMELLTQCECVHANNHRLTAFHAIARLVNDGLVTVDQDGSSLVFDLR